MSIQIHPSSVVSPEARLDEGVVVGPFCFIEGNAVIGARTQLRSHVVIGPHTELGEDNDIYPHATHTPEVGPSQCDPRGLHPPSGHRGRWWPDHHER